MSKEFLKSAINKAAIESQPEIQKVLKSQEAEKAAAIAKKNALDEKRLKKATSIILGIFARNKSLTIEELRKHMNESIELNDVLYSMDYGTLSYYPSNAELKLILETLVDGEFICRRRIVFGGQSWEDYRNYRYNYGPDEDSAFFRKFFAGGDSNRAKNQPKQSQS